METEQEKRREKVDETEGETEEREKGVISPGNSSPMPTSSTSSSPSHEFSFTLSLQNSSQIMPETTTLESFNTEKSKTAPLAIDLSPADEIFFHGHLLPLHFLSHLRASSSPRSSTNSIDGFTLPIKDVILQEDQKPTINDDLQEQAHHESSVEINSGPKDRTSRPNQKPFSLFKWRKPPANYQEEKENKIKNLKFEVSQFVKRYIKMVKPLLSSRGNRRDKVKVRRQSYSFSGMLNPRDHDIIDDGSYYQVKGIRRGEFSAPASMRTSPTNSGLLVATAGGVPSPASDSTMEELQAAIQAAIAHCKNSIASHDKPVN